MECEKALQDLWLIDQPNGPHFSGQINYLMLAVQCAPSGRALGISDLCSL